MPLLTRNGGGGNTSSMLTTITSLPAGWSRTAGRLICSITPKQRFSQHSKITPDSWSNAHVGLEAIGGAISPVCSTRSTSGSKWYPPSLSTFLHYLVLSPCLPHYFFYPMTESFFFISSGVFCWVPFFGGSFFRLWGPTTRPSCMTPRLQLHRTGARFLDPFKGPEWTVGNHGACPGSKREKKEKGQALALSVYPARLYPCIFYSLFWCFAFPFLAFELEKTKKKLAFYLFCSVQPQLTFVFNVQPSAMERLCCPLDHTIAAGPSRWPSTALAVSPSNLATGRPSPRSCNEGAYPMGLH